MIGYLKGKVLEFSEGRLLLMVPSGGGIESGAVGYSVQVPLSASYAACAPGQWTELFIYTHVREDALDLFGFLTRAEKDLYLTLLGVSGIGPKGAMGFLSGAEPAQLIDAILGGDKGFLTSLPGVGKKTAERVILELVDIIKKKVENGVFTSAMRVSRRAGGAEGAGLAGSDSAMVRDAKAALLGLGYREQEISGLLNRVAAEAEPKPTRAEELIRLALRHLTIATASKD